MRRSGVHSRKRIETNAQRSGCGRNQPGNLTLAGPTVAFGDRLLKPPWRIAFRLVLIAELPGFGNSALDQIGTVRESGLAIVGRRID